MIQLHTKNLSQIKTEHGLSQDELKNLDGNLSKHLNGILSLDQGFHTLPDIDVTKILSYADSVKGQYEDIVVCGIGGSSLGTICLNNSLGHLFKYSKDKRPKLHVMDNIDPDFLKDLQDIIELRKTLFIIVTKSGGTPETLSEYFYFRHLVESNNLNIQDHFVFLTDPTNGYLREVANEQNIQSFEIPQNVGGRWSVLTAVGLLPAALIGIDIKKLLTGAKSLQEKFYSTNPHENLSWQLAKIQYLLDKKGKNQNVMMPYSQKLIYFADWYRQLLAESIGKQENRQGEIVHVGITPIKALGATDQHSQSQLYNEGPNNKLIIFLKTTTFQNMLEIPSPEDKKFSYLKGVDFGKLLNTELEGTKQALSKYDRPHITIEIKSVNETTLGALFFLFEGATAFLGELYDINAYNQPGVELSKVLTRELLSS